MLDLLLSGGRIVVPDEGIFEADVGVAGERVAVLGAPGSLPPARQTLDVAGKLVLPGVIDPHAHFGVHGPFERDVQAETRAALAGGVTTIGCFLRESVSYHDVFERFLDSTQTNASTDFFFHFVISTEDHLAELPSYRERYGVTSFKAYMAGMKGIYGPVDDGFLLALFRQAAVGPDTIVCIHAENGAMVDRATEQLAARDGAPGLAEWSEARPDVAEEEAVERAAYLAKLAGVRLYVVHLNSRRGAEQIRRLKQGYDRLYAEGVTHYLSLSTDHPLGVLLKRVPPLRSGADVDALWQAVADGTIDALGTDNVVSSRAINQPEQGILRAKGGFTVLGTHLPVMLHEGVHRRGLDPRRVVETMTAAPARLFGLYPRKGTIAVGSDADFAVVDLDLERRVDIASLHTWSDFSPWDGQVLRGWPVATVLRGQVVVQDDDLRVASGTGRYIARGAAIPAAVAS